MEIHEITYFQKTRDAKRSKTPIKVKLFNFDLKDIWPVTLDIEEEENTGIRFYLTEVAFIALKNSVLEADKEITKRREAWKNQKDQQEQP